MLKVRDYWIRDILGVHSGRGSSLWAGKKKINKVKEKMNRKLYGVWLWWREVKTCVWMASDFSVKYGWEWDIGKRNMTHQKRVLLLLHITSVKIN